MSPIEQSLALALQHYRAGRLGDAEALYRQILASQPHPEAWFHLANTLSKGGRFDEAVSAYQNAISARSDFPEAYSNLGNALREAGRVEEAIAACRKAIALRTNYAFAHSNLANALRDSGRLNEAIASYRQAVALKPDYLQALLNLGVTLKDEGQLDESITILRQAIALVPNSAEAFNGLGITFSEKSQFDDAITCYRQAIALNPKYADAYYNLGNALRDREDLDGAIVAYRQAIALNPKHATAHMNLGNALKDTGQLEEALSAYRTASALNPKSDYAHSDVLYTLHFHPDSTAQTLADEHRRWNQQHAQAIQRYPTGTAVTKSRLRIGYVSPDLREHPVGRFILPLLAHHDKSKFEIFAYADTARPDEMTRQLQSHVDCWRETSKIDDAQLAEMINRDGIDVLVDLTLHMARGRLLSFACKPAPVQVTYLGYCSTTGLETMDYRLSDQWLDPLGQDESIYVEKTIRLKSYWCFQPSIADVEMGPLPALERGHVTFGCLNNFCKVSDGMLSACGRILRNIADSRLLLHVRQGSHRQNVRERLTRNGVDPSRVDFAPFLPTRQYLELHRAIDIGLDTFPYAGGTTTCDSLWMGVPVVTLAGKTAVGRGGVSILSNIDLRELVGCSEDEYVAIATALAGDISRVRQLRETLRERMQDSALMDEAGFALDVEDAYRQMWERHS